MKHIGTAAFAFVLATTACAKRLPEAPGTPYEQQIALAQEAGVDQTWHRARLASMALARGDTTRADATLRQMVGAMQDFHADGQFRALVGAERNKEWKGDPYEKMMAFFYMGQLLYEQGDYGNALAMTKSAILADTGTEALRYGPDFVPAFLLQAMAYDALGETRNAERSLASAVDARYRQVFTSLLSRALRDAELPDEAGTARALLQSALPAGLMAFPRDPDRALDAAFARANEIRLFALDSKKKHWPSDIEGASRGDLRRAVEHLDSAAHAWSTNVPPERVRGAVRKLDGDERVLSSLLEDPSLVLWIEQGGAPTKTARGRYNEVLTIEAGGARHGPPAVWIDRDQATPLLAGDVLWQATTRGSRRIDGFLKGKAAFKDASEGIGLGLLYAGAFVNYGDNSSAGLALQLAGLLTWLGGALTHAEADVRAWQELPDTLWLVRADLPPGTHDVRIDDRSYRVKIPERGHVSHLVPRMAPGGPRSF